MAIALRSGSFTLLRDEGSSPILILDDIFAELDTVRRAQLVALVFDHETHHLVAHERVLQRRRTVAARLLCDVDHIAHAQRHPVQPAGLAAGGAALEGQPTRGEKRAKLSERVTTALRALARRDGVSPSTVLRQVRL